MKGSEKEFYHFLIRAWADFHWWGIFLLIRICKNPSRIRLLLKLADCEQMKWNFPVLRIQKANRTEFGSSGTKLWVIET